MRYAFISHLVFAYTFDIYSINMSKQSVGNQMSILPKINHMIDLNHDTLRIYAVQFYLS